MQEETYGKYFQTVKTLGRTHKLAARRFPPACSYHTQGFGGISGQSILTHSVRSIHYQNKTMCFLWTISNRKILFFIKQLLLYNGSSVLIIFIFPPKDLFYITKQICQLLRKFSSFLLQMIEGELIYVKGKVGIIKTSV